MSQNVTLKSLNWGVVGKRAKGVEINDSKFMFIVTDFIQKLGMRID